MTPIVLSWSSGKDSAWALHLLRESGEFDVRALVTTVNAATGRVPIHGTPAEILEAQATAVGLPLVAIPLDWPCSNKAYEQAVAGGLLDLLPGAGVRTIAFGDLFLSDIRSYREEFCSRIGWQPCFPLWGQNTADLGRRMIAGGLEALVSCVDTAKLPQPMLGRAFDASFLADLPENTDPCGENGEFHTIVTNSPEFRYPIRLFGSTRAQFGSLVSLQAGLRRQEVQ